MIGRTISHYKILEKLGEGGMGVVYKAEDTKLKRTVALKFLPLNTMVGEEEKARFAREAQAAAALDHPNICTVYEINEADGQTFIAMAYVEGKSLQEMIGPVGATGRSPLAIDDVLDYAIQIAGGLQAAHEKEIVHRDIKPANILLTEKAMYASPILAWQNWLDGPNSPKKAPPWARSRICRRSRRRARMSITERTFGRWVR